MRNLLFFLSLVLTSFFEGRMGHVTVLADDETSSIERSHNRELAPSRTELSVKLSTATGKTIVFKPVERESEGMTNADDHEIPHLVLKRNGILTPGFERTLNVSVEDLVVPPSGLHVQLVIETQHKDPDLERKNNARIRVWKETSFVPYNALVQEGVDVQFSVTFDPVMELIHKSVKTPTDYYRCRISVFDAQGNPLQSYVSNYAFLMENQWRVPLPDVLEATPGAAPDELLVYYYDMLPFQLDLMDPDTRIPRQYVDRYIQTELIPAMVEAFKIQSNIWEFPWYEEWHNYRREEPPKTLSVALGEYEMWFHGRPTSLGHSMISIRVDGAVGEYDTLTDGLMSVFHHELFHNHQRNLSLHYGNHGAIAGKDEAWMMFSEGTAVLASSVGQPTVQFEISSQPRSYLRRANAFIGSEGVIGGGLNKSYKNMPYQTTLYWRFLYEKCGGITLTGEDPSAGLKVIRRVLETLYKGEIVQISSSTDVASALPRIMDHVLQSTPSCEFKNYEESLIQFARAIYQLRLEDGRCPGLTGFANCGFADPRRLYHRPPAETLVLSADKATEISGSIPSSYGIDFIELELSPSMQGRTLKIGLASPSDPRLEFHVEVWKTRIIIENGESKLQSAQVAKPVSISTQKGNLTIEIEDIDRAAFDGLGLIITRMDPYEDTEVAGAYLIQILAE